MEWCKRKDERMDRSRLSQVRYEGGVLSVGQAESLSKVLFLWRAGGLRSSCQPCSASCLSDLLISLGLTWWSRCSIGLGGGG